MEKSKTLLDFFGTNDISVASLSKPNNVDPSEQILSPWKCGGMSDLFFQKVLAKIFRKVPRVPTVDFLRSSSDTTAKLVK